MYDAARIVDTLLTPFDVLLQKMLAGRAGRDHRGCGVRDQVSWGSLMFGALCVFGGESVGASPRTGAWTSLPYRGLENTL